MVLKLYNYPRSPDLVALVCLEKEIPYELVPIDFATGEQNTPEFRQQQPFGQVPYIDDDGFILYEARAIARYLIKKYPDKGTQGLIPTDPKEEALFEQASSVEVANFDTHAAPLVRERVFKQLRGLEPDETKAAEYQKKLEASLDVYDVILGKQKYLAGNNLTLADLQHLSYGTVLFTANLGHLFTDRPNVKRWWSDISSRDSWLAAQNAP